MGVLVEAPKAPGAQVMLSPHDLGSMELLGTDTPPGMEVWRVPTHPPARAHCSQQVSLVKQVKLPSFSFWIWSS